MEPTKNLKGRVKEVEGRVESMEGRLGSLEKALLAMTSCDLPSARADHGSKGKNFNEGENPSEIAVDGTWVDDFEPPGVFSHYGGEQLGWHDRARKTANVGSFNVYTVQGNIAKLNVDVIVNAANRQLRAGSGVCRGIFKEAGAELQKVCDDLAPIKEGEAVITEGFNCPASFIVHAVGPMYSVPLERAKKLLYDAYTNAMKKADLVEARTVAFPCISSGLFGFPEWTNAQVALRAIRDFKPEHLRMAVFCNIDDATFLVYDKMVAAQSDVPCHPGTKKQHFC